MCKFRKITMCKDMCVGYLTLLCENYDQKEQES